MFSEIGEKLTRSVLRRTGSHPAPAGMEWAVAVVLWLYLFSLILCLVVGRSVGSALFLNRFDGAGLALIYVLVGLTVAVLVGCLDRIGRDHSSVRVSATTLVLMYCILVAVGYVQPRLPANDFAWLYGAFYLLIESFAFITTVQFWSTASAALTTEQARRLYVFIGTGGVVGSIVGGLLTRELAGQPPAHVVLLLAAAVPFQLFLVFLFDRVSFGLQSYRPKHDRHWNLEGRPDAAEALDGERQSTPTPRHGNAMMEGPPTLPHRRRDWPKDARKLSRRFGLVVMLMVFSTTLVDFYYKMFADRLYEGDTDHLTVFFGNFYLAVGATTLLLQVAATPLLLKHGAAFLGLFASPISLIATTVVSLLNPGIWSAAAFKLTDSVLTHSLYRSCHETLFTPLPTGWVRQLKSTCDGVYGRMGLLFAGAFLFLLSPLLEMFGPAWLLPWIALSLLGWSLAIANLRRTYRPQLAGHLEISTRVAAKDTENTGALPASFAGSV